MRSSIRERTRQASRTHAPAAGQWPTVGDDAAKNAAVRQVHDSREHAVEAIARALGVSRATIYRALDDRPRRRPGSGSRGAT